jgi:2-C-methyl-D-erythritol 4-phosphate cytidylyltransferase
MRWHLRRCRPPQSRERRVAGRIWFVIAAAGAAMRFGGSIPKPYLRVGGLTLLEHALRALLAVPRVAGGVVVVARGDRRYARLPAALRRRFVIAAGGATRARSVLNGLIAIAGAEDPDWVLVHDAARPCLPQRDVERLVSSCRGDPVGGLLATPVTDTLKRMGRQRRSLGSVPRARLWRAQTPQMFRYGTLRSALARSLDEGFEPTDEATAIERLGLRPRLVEGSPLNVKVTSPSDLTLAQAIHRLSGGKSRR